MKVSKTDKNDVQIIQLSGRLDGNTSPKAQEEITALLDMKKMVVIDMAECSFISSAGLRVLLNLAKTLARNGGQGALAGLADEVADVMKITGFGNVFPCFTNADQALAALKKGK